MTARWVTVLVAAVVLFGTIPGRAAPDETPPRFRLVQADTAQRLERRLLAAAAQGYRLVAAAQGENVSGQPQTSVLMERSGEVATPTYRVLTCSGSFKKEETAATLATLGGEGYHLNPRSITSRKLRDVWLPDSAYEEQMTLILQRDAEGQRYEFESLGFGDYDRFYSDLRDRREQGSEVLGMWNTGRRLQVILQRRTDTGAPESGSESPEHRLLLMATRGVLDGKIESAAADGFRILAAVDPTTIGPPVVLLERVASPGNVIDYGFLDDVPVKQNKDKLERKLGKKARQGWRIAPRGTTAEVITLERFTRESDRTSEAHYRLVSSRRAPGLSKSLEEAMDGGYTFVRLFVEPDEATVLLEKIAD